VGSSSLLVPASIVKYVQRTKERVILDDTAGAGKFSSDEYLSRRKPRSLLCLPILRQAEVVGVLYLENDLLAGVFTPERLMALELLATQAAISVQNASLLAKERTARAAAEEERSRSAFLAEAGELLAEPLDTEETLVRLARLCVHSMADWCVIDVLLDGQEIRSVAGAHADPAKEPLIRELQRRYPPRWDSPHPAARVLRSGEPLLLPEMSGNELRSFCEDDEHLRLLHELGTRTGLAVPLAARGQTLGVISLSSASSGRSYGRADLELAQELARRAATAVDNARLYRKAQEAVRLRDEFLSIAAHELYTPMTSLMLSLQALASAVHRHRNESAFNGNAVRCTERRDVDAFYARGCRRVADIEDVHGPGCRIGDKGPARSRVVGRDFRAGFTEAGRIGTQYAELERSALFVPLPVR
jgi:GAF domain-containing protein